MRSRWRVAMAVAGSWLLVGVSVQGQYREDAMEPAELGIQDVQQVRVPRTEYVGNDLCRQCHEAAYQRWLGTAHARGYLPLFSMMAAMMGREQRITAGTPYRSGMCLTCHATAHDVAAAYRGPGFRMGEGVTCEKCHGPGGDHVRFRERAGAAVDSAAAAMARPAETWCQECHKHKESHAGVPSRVRHLGRANAWARIAHPSSAERPEDETEPAELGIWYLEETADTATTQAAFVGTAACGACHAEALAKWRQTPHAQAFVALRQEAAYAMDLVNAVATVGGPARNGRCLSCHSTGHAAPAARRAQCFRLREGVGCEACHGPGSDHVYAMQGHMTVPQMGLTQHPTQDSCAQCHRRQRSHDRLGRPPFDGAKALEAVIH